LSQLYIGFVCVRGCRCGDAAKMSVAEAGRRVYVNGRCRNTDIVSVIETLQTMPSASRSVHVGTQQLHTCWVMVHDGFS